MTSNKKLYVKSGKRYVSAAEILPDAWFFRYGTYLVNIKKNGSSTATLTPGESAPLFAASMLIQDKLVDIISEASKYHPPKSIVTKEQALAWDNMSAAFGGLSSITAPAQFDISKEILRLLREEAGKLLTNDSVKEAYENFLFVSEMSNK